jgi:GGDEF domain-containing protein
VDGADRLRAVTPSVDALTTLGRSIRQLVRRGDLLAHEDDGRIWVIAPGSGRAGGVALASRLADAVRHSGELRGAPLTASVGLAVYPEDGIDAASLTDHAEEQMYAARASGISVAGRDPDEPFRGGL